MYTAQGMQVQQKIAQLKYGRGCTPARVQQMGNRFLQHITNAYLMCRGGDGERREESGKRGVGEAARLLDFHLTPQVTIFSLSLFLVYGWSALRP